MADDERLHKRVTEFMIETCCNGVGYKHTAMACLFRGYAYAAYGAHHADVLTTGSSAEFYIDPLLTCVDDIDVMCSSNDSIAISAGQSPPLELPAHFHSTLRAHEIIDSNRPGYVYLRPSYTLHRGNNGRYYPVTDADENLLVINGVRYTPAMQYVPHASIVTTCAMSSLYREAEETAPIESSRTVREAKFQIGSKGPAEKFDVRISPNFQCSGINPYLLRLILPVSKFDHVPYIRCAVWPRIAADWPVRHRYHGWPDSQIIDTVVSNGCDVVQAVHPLCRIDEWMRKHQWRLSFSRAEVTLLNSWTPLQQIVYHMLRFVIKKEIIISVEDARPTNLPTLSSYHIKTLMLWACEQKPQCWWSAEYSVVKLCSYLISELCDMVSARTCQHYFISECKLLDYCADRLRLCNGLKRLSDANVLLLWFLDNYVQTILCDFNISTELPLSISHDICVERIMKEVYAAEAMQQYTSIIGFERHLLSFVQFARYVDLFKAVIDEVRHHSGQSADYSIAVASLHIANVASTHSLIHDAPFRSVADPLELLCTLYEPCASDISDSVMVIIEHGATGAIMKAIHLAKGSNSHRISMDRVYVEMSKAFLHRSLKRGDNCVRTSADYIAHMLLALLYGKTGHYRRALGHCHHFLRYSGEATCGLRCIGAEYLTSINFDVDAMFGLIIFYQELLKNVFSGKEVPYREHLELTTELLGHYLNTTCSVIVEKQDGFVAPGVCQRIKYRRCLLHTEQVLVSDILLYKSAEMQMGRGNKRKVVTAVDDYSYSSNDMDTSSLVFWLRQLALENLNCYRSAMICELNPAHSPGIINEFEMLYLYNCGLYEKCLNVCSRNLDSYLCLGDTTVGSNSIPVIFAELLSLLNGDLVSLCGIIALLCPSKLERMCRFPDFFSILCATLSLYLLAECWKKVGSNSVDDTLRLVIRTNHRHIELFPWAGLDRLTVVMIYRSLRLLSNTSR